MASIRVYYGKEHGLRGRCRMNFNWPPINRHSTVIITAGEATDVAPQAFDLKTAFVFLLGDADVYVTNVSPHDGGVEFILHVNWPNPLNVVVDITVLEPAQQVLRV